jgi:Flp pilus assembly protein TadG
MHMTLSRRLADDRSGVALIEFAYSLPIVLALGLYGLETAKLAVDNLRVSQVALNLADNASRVGVQNNLAVQQLREVDINDVLEAVRIEGEKLDITRRGRITLTSLEADASGTQRIHWQRCIGLKSGANWDSSYGTTSPSSGTDDSPANAGTLAPGGIGPAGAKVIAPPSSGLMFVEVNYEYDPLFTNWMLTSGRIHYTASFIVRDRRDFTQVYNPTPSAVRATCDRHTT